MSDDVAKMVAQQEGESATQEMELDGRVLPDEPIRKGSNPYRTRPQYLCPHCAADLSGPDSMGLDAPDDEGTPEEVMQHIRECEGLDTYHLGLQARRRRKAQWLARLDG